MGAEAVEDVEMEVDIGVLLAVAARHSISWGHNLKFV